MATEPRVWTLTLPGMPPNLLNARLSTRDRIGAVRMWRERAAWAARLAEIPPLARVRLSAVFFRRNLGVADEDGDRCRLKPLVDGIVAAGVLPRDTRRYVVWDSVLEAHGPPGVVLTIAEVWDGA